MVHALKGARVAGVGSPRASVEANYLLRELVGAEHFCPGASLNILVEVRVLELPNRFKLLVSGAETRLSIRFAVAKLKIAIYSYL